jgi:hypothetical protein
MKSGTQQETPSRSKQQPGVPAPGRSARGVARRALHTLRGLAAVATSAALTPADVLVVGLELRIAAAGDRAAVGGLLQAGKLSLSFP